MASMGMGVISVYHPHPHTPSRYRRKLEKEGNMLAEKDDLGAYKYLGK
jgi:hypothetical protein